MHTVEKTENAPKAHTPSGACPGFFKAACATARSGGDNGYANAASQLTGALEQLAPREVEDDEWRERLEVLFRFIEGSDTDGQIIEWFEENLPRCLALVPKRRHFAFVCGVRRFVIEGI
ncbi:MAG: hypothetical protein ACHQWU_09130 [Gemmatimonadales bacterium]